MHYSVSGRVRKSGVPCASRHGFGPLNEGNVVAVDAEFLNWGLLAGVLIVICVGSLLKGITGVGLPILAVPLLASFTSVEEAVVLMVLPGFASNFWLVVMHRKWRILRDHYPFLACGVIGGLLGTWLLATLDDRVLKAILASWLGIYLVRHFSRRSAPSSFGSRGGLGGVLGFAAGTIQGASGISAPIVAPYFHASGLVRDRYAFATATAFLLFSVAQLAGMNGLHLWTPERLATGVAVVIPTLLFTHLGIRLSHSISDRAFDRVILVLFLAMELKLIVDII